MKVRRDAQYLFLCHLEWHKEKNLEAYHELVAALDDHDPDIRQVAESLLHRPSPYPQRKKQPAIHGASERPAWTVAGKGDRRAG